MLLFAPSLLPQSVRSQGASAELKLGGNTGPLFSTQAIADAIKTSIGSGINQAKSGVESVLAGAGSAHSDLKSAAAAGSTTESTASSSVADALAKAITAGVASGSTSGSPAAASATDSKLGPLQAALAAHAQQADAQLKQLSGAMASSLASFKGRQPGQLLQNVMSQMTAMG